MDSISSRLSSFFSGGGGQQQSQVAAAAGGMDRGSQFGGGGDGGAPAGAGGALGGMYGGGEGLGGVPGSRVTVFQEEDLAVAELKVRGAGRCLWLLFACVFLLFCDFTCSKSVGFRARELAAWWFYGIGRTRAQLREWSLGVHPGFGRMLLRLIKRRVCSAARSSARKHPSSTASTSDCSVERTAETITGVPNDFIADHSSLATYRRFPSKNTCKTDCSPLAVFFYARCWVALRA